ncbi:hypothetical protein E4U25_006949 [Claviceps purpurea]|nr:hypothetical protein E4U51_005409 [Claviceps purpurea]KAG6231641.1 hypothetical protein E4U25_006949 [Claviceps purpurea]
MSFIRDFYSIAVYILFYLISNTTDTQQLERYVPNLAERWKARHVRLHVLNSVERKGQDAVGTPHPRAKTQEGDPTPTVQRSDSAVVLRSM